LNVYGHSKLAGDNVIRQAGGAWLILRTAWVYSGARGRNILRTILRVLRERQELRMVANQIGIPASRCEEIHLDWIMAQLRERDELPVDGGRTGAPTSAVEIAGATAAIIEAAALERAQGCFTSGLLHLTAAGATSWHGFAKAVLENAVRYRLVAAGDALRLVSTADDDSPAMLPKHSRLSGDRLSQRYGITLPHWREGLAHCLEEQALTLEPA
jgi:dTDP-4-dehydrorhamnose reductase